MYQDGSETARRQCSAHEQVPSFIPLPALPVLSLPGMGDKMGKVAGPEQSDKRMYRQKRREEIKRRRWLLARFDWQPPLGGSIDTAIRVHLW